MARRLRKPSSPTFQLLMILGGVAAMVYYGYDAWRFRQSADFKTVKGVVLEKKLNALVGANSKSRYSSERRTYIPRIQYSFVVDGKVYNGSSDIPMGGGSQAWAQQSLDKFEIDGPCEVFYNPRDPGTNSLHRNAGEEKLPFAVIAGLLGLGVVVVGVSGFVQAIRRIRDT